MESLFDRPEFNAALFFPRRASSPPPEGARDLRVRVAPEVQLHVRLHLRPGAAPLVLLFHGNGEVVPDYDAVAPYFAAAGADLGVADFRGYGASEGTPTLRTMLADAEPVLRAVCAAVPERALLVMGRSLGSGCAAQLCRTTRPAVRGYVFESGIADLTSMVRRRGIAPPGALPEADLADFDPQRRLRECRTPALVLHGERDGIIPVDEARAAYEALGSRDKELVLVPDRGHNDVSMHPLYWAALKRFVARTAGPGATA